MPIDYFSQAQQFGHAPPGGPRAGLKLKWPTNGTARLLRAALLQHCIVVASMDALRRHPRKPSIASVADGGRVDLRQLRMALRGQAYMQIPQVATLASVAPDALPDPEWVHDVLTKTTLVFRRQITKTGQGIPGAIGLMSADEIAAEATLGALQGWVGVEPDTDEEQADERLSAAAHPLLERSTLDQARAAGLAHETTHPQRDGIVIRAAHASAAVDIDGCYDPAGPIVAAHLPNDWIETVHESGWTVIEGHFIAQVVATRGGRPQTVRAVRLHPEPAEDGQGEWLYRADLATVGGPDDRPTLTFSGPASPR